MKILDVRELALPEVKVVTVGRFPDERGYFAETFKRSDLLRDELSFLRGMEFVQTNESRSRPGVLRGLHFQWKPPQGKLVRTVAGRMIDLVCDIRSGSPTYGRIIAHDMPVGPDDDRFDWIWVPPGFAHGNVFTEPTVIEYHCTGEYAPDCEGGVRPTSADLDWSLCDPRLKAEYDCVVAAPAVVSEKDAAAPDLAGWAADPRSAEFPYEAR